MKIGGFFNEWRNLSNYGVGELTIDGIRFPSRENAYHWFKGILGGEDPKSEHMTRFHSACINADKTEVLSVYTPNQAKQAGKKVKLHPDWDSRLKYGVMRECIKAALNENEFLRVLLLSTGDAELEESNWWHDVYWGRCVGTLTLNGEERKCKHAPHEPIGENNLGKLLMELRDEVYLDKVLADIYFKNFVYFGEKGKEY